MSTVSVIFNLFRRPDGFKAQYESVINQTVKPDEILMWRNEGSSLEEFDQDILSHNIVANSNFNFGVWGRLAFALNANSDYILILDDDTKLGNRWIENCLKIQEKEKCILGTIGVIFNDLTYQNYYRVGWANPNNEIQEADVLGHCWFFPREVLHEMWAKERVPTSPICGEDFALCRAAQRLGMRIAVPPHPVDDMSVWGSIPDHAWHFGCQSHAVSINYHHSHFAKALQEHYDKGFKFLNIT